MKTTLKLFGAAMLLALSSESQTGEIRGYLKAGSENVMYATVKVLQGNMLMGGGLSDENGKYSVKALNPGTYELIVLSPEYMTQKVNAITVKPNQTTYVDVKLQANELGTVTVVAKAYDYTQSGVDQDVFHTVSLSGRDLLQSASIERGNVKDALTYMSSDAISGPDGQMHVRGARAGATGFFIDGVRTLQAHTIPGLGIENISAFTGGVPAMYGDLMSGAVIITTKTYFSGIRDKNVRKAQATERDDADE